MSKPLKWCLMAAAASGMLACGGTVSVPGAGVDGRVAGDGGAGSDASSPGADAIDPVSCAAPGIAPAADPARQNLDEATVAITNAYYGCDPNAGTVACSDLAPGPDPEPQLRLGRPTRGGPALWWCPGRLSHALCRSFVPAPQVEQVTGPAIPNAKAFAAAFEHGVLYAFLDGASWRVVEVVDEPEGASLAALHAAFAAVDDPAIQSALGVPLGPATAGAQRFVADCCAYTVREEGPGLSIAGEGAGCALPAAQDNPAPLSPFDVAYVVNGNPLNAAEEQALRYFAQRTVMPLTSYFDGDRAEAVARAAIVAWWSLKEGVLDTPNPIAFSLCDSPRTVLTDQPHGVCEEEAWQVGVAAVQAPRPPGSPSNWFNDPIGDYVAAYEASAVRCFPGLSAADVLRRTAREAGYAETDEETEIVQSSDFVRAAWLLRSSPVGVAHQYERVQRECFDGTKSWCYGTGWRETKLFAPTRAAAFTARDEIGRLLDALAR